MAATLTLQNAAASVPSFVGKVRMAMCAAAVSISSEATTLTGGIPAGAVTALKCAALPSAIPATSTVAVGGEVFTSAAGAAQNATSIPVSGTAAVPHFAGEVITPPTLANHVRRVAYARAVLNNPDLYAPLFAAALASQAIDDTSTDVAITNGVSAAWDALAGVL
jgi:hypothetical protein